MAEHNASESGVPDLHGTGLAIGRHVLVQMRTNDLQEVGQSIYTYISLDMILCIYIYIYIYKFRTTLFLNT